MMAFEKTEQIIQEMVDHQIVPGLDYTVIHHGKIIRDVTTGYSEIYPQKVKLKPNQYFDLASLTKVIGTVPLILILEQRNQLKLDDSICKYLPQIQNHQVTIRHLITHTSGASAWIDNRDNLTASQLREAINHAIEFNPDQMIDYNDYNYLLLGFIVERLMHIPLQTAIRREILMPLGLKQSTFDPDPFVTVPTALHEGIYLKGRVHDPKAASLGQHAGSAGLFATKADIVLFTQKMLAKENEIFDAKTLTRFLKNQTANPNLKRSFGWAFLKQNTNQVLLRHSGFTGTVILFDRLTQNGLILLSNRVHPHPAQTFLDYRQRIYKAFIDEDF